MQTKCTGAPHRVKLFPKPMTLKCSGNNPLAPEHSKNPQGVFSSFPATIWNQNSARIKDKRSALSKRWDIIHTPVFWIPLIYFHQSMIVLRKKMLFSIPKNRIFRKSPKSNVLPQPLAMVTPRGIKIKSTLLCSHRRTTNKIKQQSFPSSVLNFCLDYNFWAF